jgi:hypothetical protein
MRFKRAAAKSPERKTELHVTLLPFPKIVTRSKCFPSAKFGNPGTFHSPTTVSPRFRRASTLLFTSAMLSGPRNQPSVAKYTVVTL